MKLSYEDHGTISVVSLTGELTADQTDNFRRNCTERLNNGIRDILLDLEHLRLVDSEGLESLLWLQDQVAQKSGQVRLVRPEQTVRDVLRVTRLERRFNIHETVEGAAKSLR